MKMIQESRQTIQQPRTTQIRFVFWDILKMLGTAMLCGLAVSMTAAAITLLLTGSAEARRLQQEAAQPAVARDSDFEDEEFDDPSPTPGALLLGDACDRIVLSAFERDWQVRIDGNQVEVRVMQAYQLPDEGTEVATFHVQLMKGAHMRSLSAQSLMQDWSGHLISAEAYQRLTTVEYLSLTSKQILTSVTTHGTVATSPIIGLKSGELLTIAYVYTMALDATAGKQAFILPLEVTDKHEMSPHGSVESMNAFNSSKVNPTPPIRGAVWVAWTGSKPSRVLGLPFNADLEISNSRIEGFSWATAGIHPGAALHLAWAP